MKLGIVIPTYQREDGSTPLLIKRAIESVKNQSHQDFILLIIGDKYEDNIEFEKICLEVGLGEKLLFNNLQNAEEREKYPKGSKELWSSGGVSARNKGIEWGLSLGLEYICPLDHDDYWHPQHLEVINHTIMETGDASFINTCSTYLSSYLPRVELTNEIQPSQIKPGGCIHSSVCINHKLIPIKYRDVFEETGQEFAADADMWVRIGDYIKKNNLKSYQITSLTCFHPTENI